MLIMTKLVFPYLQLQRELKTNLQVSLPNTEDIKPKRKTKTNKVVSLPIKMINFFFVFG